MERFLMKLSMWFVILALFEMSGYKGCMEEERIGLLELKSFLISADDSFRSLKQLKILNLSYNKFNDSILPYLATLSSLVTLNLYDNRIEGLKPKRGLANLKNLEVLVLGGNNISTASMTMLGLANLRNLRKLDLSENEITISGSLISQGLTKFRNLKALGLGDNVINGTLESQGICELKNIVELDLSENNFNGPLPLCLSNLTSIKALDFSSNQLSGNLPSVIVNLTSLEYLAVSNNNFEGLFSFSSIANLSKLRVFQLSNCSLQVENEKFPWLPKFQLEALYLRSCNLHSIPSFLRYQYDLRLVDLSSNNLVGKFSTWLLQNNTNLEHLYLMNNSLSGSLPLPSSKHALLHLDISINNFSGPLPCDIGKILPHLTYVRMSENNFEGSIPSSMGEMKQLQELDLSTNKFSGELPKEFVSGCVLLSTLILSNNQFQGSLFPKYMNMTKFIKWLYLNSNNFSGKIEDGLPNASLLFALDLSSNKFSGQIPHWIGNILNLKYLSMANNSLEGDIPAQLSNLKFLRVLDISENRLSGSITSSSNLSSLRHLYMHKNAFKGSIPDALRRNLRILILRGNHLWGRIPDQICQLKKIQIIDLSYNKFNGAIPQCFTNMTSWMLGYDVINLFAVKAAQVVYLLDQYFNSTLGLSLVEGDDRPSGQREIEFLTKYRYESYQGNILNYMTGLDLSCNQLTGDIPSEIGNFSEILALNFSHNFLSGSIPESFSNLKKIESLDLSHNKLSGLIPPQLIKLNFLSNFNVSYNNLSGPTPNGGQFANFDEGNYGSNPGLCGPTINKSCSSVPNSPTTPSTGAKEYESSIDMVAFNWGFVASFVTVVLALFSILWINAYWCQIWFYFVDACTDLCLRWILKCV
ncbi:putative Leucine-rich receptor-like kinase family protein [Melia azedarach]|uniref:Leucine-rich receptor-like kinase family protein n=1 Tax=Melia azedarach TaxID=155640 RepID=A0ACC1Y464_MELAZ|nr:putative Leucine-rich receptor-like kinase family protein [Melia azedarach]